MKVRKSRCIKIGLLQTEVWTRPVPTKYFSTRESIFENVLILISKWPSSASMQLWHGRNVKFIMYVHTFRISWKFYSATELPIRWMNNHSRAFHARFLSSEFSASRSRRTTIDQTLNRFDIFTCTRSIFVFNFTTRRLQTLYNIFPLFSLADYALSILKNRKYLVYYKHMFF